MRTRTNNVFCSYCTSTMALKTNLKCLSAIFIFLMKLVYILQKIGKTLDMSCSICTFAKRAIKLVPALGLLFLVGQLLVGMRGWNTFLNFFIMMCFKKFLLFVDLNLGFIIFTI